MLHNVVDMTKVLATLQQEGVEVTPEIAKCFSPLSDGASQAVWAVSAGCHGAARAVAAPTALCDDCVRPLWHPFTRLCRVLDYPK